MFISALSFLAGIALVQQLPALPTGEMLLLGILAAVMLARLRCTRSLLVLLGFLWASAFAHHRLSERLSVSLEGSDLRIQGRITGLPDINEKNIRFDFAIDRSSRALPARIRLSWYHPDHPVRAGQHWLLTVRLKRPHGTLNPGGFDYERWLLQEGIGATGYVRHDPKPVLLPVEPAWHRIDHWRQAISDRLAELPIDPPSLGLIRALTIGDGSGIGQHQWQIFRETGTTHLVVISGSHIGLVSGLVYFLALRIWTWTGILRWPPPAVAAIISLIAAVLYSALAGFTVPTQRAVIMLSVVLASIILKRHCQTFHTLALALFAVLIIDPIAVLSAGFWLSFTAVGLIVFAVSGRLGKAGRLMGAFKIHWLTAAGLSPLLLLYFRQISLISPLANLVAVPVISLLAVPLSLLGTAVLWIAPSIAIPLFDLVALFLETLNRLLAYMAESPAATVSHREPSPWALGLAVPGLLLLLAPAGTPSRWLSPIMLLPLIGTASIPLKPGEFRLILLDVGQGLAAAVQTGNHWLVYDTGARFSEDNDMGQSVLLPFLKSEGAVKISRLIISHGDNDHIGGSRSVLNGIATESLMTSVPEQLRNYAPTRCVAGQSWQWDEVRFKMLSPAKTWSGGANNNSCVLKIESKAGSVLLPGDIEAETESWLVHHRRSELEADILIAPHHGSRTSSSAPFLEAVGPGLVLIPSGYRNPFGHPHPSVLSRYRQIGARWLSSADSGAIVVELKRHSATVSALRQTEKRYWRSQPDSIDAHR
ncbi:MAG: DNA internalization-related competence protein ComEC/Rec2 [Gammaproteobacteria bacterium]